MKSPVLSHKGCDEKNFLINRFEFFKYSKNKGEKARSGAEEFILWEA
jgi:hypothetical protein